MRMIGIIEYKTLINHYIQMERVQLAGGLRKELSPLLCVVMMIKYVNPEYNPIEAMIVAGEVRKTVKEIQSIPF